MWFPPVLAALSFIAFAQAQNFSSYLPDCAPPCVEQTLNSSKICTGLDDNKCLCTNFPRIVFPSISCFMQSCDSINRGDLRSVITSGWQKFCNDSGTPISTSGFPGGPGGPESPVPTFSATSSATSSTTTTSSSTSLSTTFLTAPSDTVSATSSGLSTGAKAGIGVGVGVGSLAVIGGLVYLGFRLGRRKRNRASRIAAENAPPVDGVGHPGSGQGTEDWTNAEGGAEHWAYKVQPEGAAELQSDHVRELPADDRPVELGYGAMPSELSADAEIPRSNIARL